MSTFLAGLRSRRWLNAGVFALGVLALTVAVATPLYARSSAEHLLDQRTAQRPVTETGLTVATASGVGAGRTAFVTTAFVAGGRDDAEEPPPLTDADRAEMLDRVGALIGTPAADSYWGDPTSYLLSQGEYRSGGRTYQINAYWREGMCQQAHVEGRCPSAPGEALIDPTMLGTIREDVGDQVSVVYTATVTAKDGSERVVDFPTDYTIVGTYTIDDPTDTTWFDPSRTVGDGTLRPPSLGSPNAPLIAPALLVDPSSITFASASIAGADRPVDLDALDIATMDDASRQLTAWQAEVAEAGAPVLQPDDLVSFDNLFTAVRSEQALLSRVTLAAVVPLIVLALLLLYVLVASAAEARRPEVALAKLRGFSTGQVVRFAVAEPVAVLLVSIPVGIGLAVLAERVVGRIWLGATPFVVTPQAVASAVAVVVTGLLATLVAVTGVVREPVASSLASRTRRPASSRWGLLAQGALVMLSAAAVVQIVTSDATESSSFVELLAPLFVALGLAVLAFVVLGVVARAWARRTSERGGLAPFLASRRLVRRHDLALLVLPLLLATAMAGFAASAWKVADDWRVSKAAASVGAATVYYTDTDPARLLWVARDADPEGRYLTAAVPPAPRTEDGARVALVDSRSFGHVAAWDRSWSSSAAEAAALLAPPERDGPITFSGERLAIEVTGIALRGRLNFPLEVWLRYVPTDSGEERLAPIGTLPARGSASLDGFVSGCAQGCSVEQLVVSGGSSSVTDAHGRFTIASIRAQGSTGTTEDWRLDAPEAWRPARPFPEGVSPVTLEADPAGLRVTIAQGTPGVVRLTTTDLPEAPAVLLTRGTVTEPPGADPGQTINGASILGARTPMTLAGTTGALPLVGNEGGLSDLQSALREYGDQAFSVSLTALLAAADTPESVLTQVEDAGVSLTDRRTEAEELQTLRSDAFSLGWRVFLAVGVVTLLLAFLGVLALAIVQLRWRSYEVAALRVVGVRRRDLRRAIVAEYVALLGLATAGGAVAAVLSLVLVLPSLDIGTVGTYDPAVDYGLRWLVIGGVLAVVLLVVLAIALWIARRTVRLGTPASLRQADLT